MNENLYDNLPTASQFQQIEIRNLRKVHESEKLRHATLVVKNFIYFTANFPSPFEIVIQQAFQDNGQVIVDHLTSKYRGISEKYISAGCFPPAAVLDFFFALDGANQSKLIFWVQTNYHFSSVHK